MTHMGSGTGCDVYQWLREAQLSVSDCYCLGLRGALLIIVMCHLFQLYFGLVGMIITVKC